MDAKIVFREGSVFLHKFCPAHGKQECLLASSVEWYLDCLSFLAPDAPPERAAKPVTKGCPFDCGPCPAHRQRVFLPVIPITSACNLDCPVCYTINRNRDAYHLSKGELERILDRLLEDGAECDIVNFTGGEPTLHPELPEFLALCRERGIRRLTVSTNGIRLREESVVRALAEAGARIILSLDTLRPETDRALVGADTVAAKLEVLALLEKHDVPTTILPAVALGWNDDEVGALFDLVVERPHVLSLEMHTMAFTGQGGTGFPRSARITIPDLHRRIESASGGHIGWRDFVPSPLAHPHCYSICYVLLVDGGGYVPFTRLMSREKLFDLLGESLYIEPREKLEEVFREMIDDLWANPDRIPESQPVLRTLKRLLKEMFPESGPPPLRERQRIAERSAKAIYIHSHMDEESFDVSRVVKCCVGVPEADGTSIPTCSYNVLYREKDPRFASATMRERMEGARIEARRARAGPAAP